jgi:hypothetical protein
MNTSESQHAMEGTASHGEDLAQWRTRAAAGDVRAKGALGRYLLAQPTDAMQEGIEWTSTAAK